jgi:hypothetical protein
MSDIKDGGPAFPGPDQMETEVDIHEGMSLRDYFAAKALGASMRNLADQPIGGSPKDWQDFVAKDCYDIADAMLRAREA